MAVSGSRATRIDVATSFFFFFFFDAHILAVLLFFE